MKEYGDYGSLKGPVNIGIDQSYSGFAVTLLDAEGHFHTTVYKGQGKGVERLINIEDHLIGRVGDARDDLGISEVAMEGYAPGSKFGREAAGELGGMVKTCLYFNWGVHPLIVTPSQLKKYVTGKGNTQKNQILLHTFAKWGVTFEDDNAADSYGLARMAAGMHDHKYEEEVIRSLHREVA